MAPTFPRGRDRLAAVAFGSIVSCAMLLSGCAVAAQSTGAAVVTVPTDAATITEAVSMVSAGGLILVEPGTYTESVSVNKNDVTIRGTDRNTVVIDGEGLRPNGIEVIAGGVRIQNLTVVNHTFNGVLVTGLHDANGAQAHSLDGYSKLDPEKFPPLQRFEVSNVTASNNGLYGIYAFNSQHGVIRDNYTSGSADSGFYVGQCAECDILVTGNVAENNAIGYENANASDSVIVVGNRFTSNRVGLTLISWYQEAYLPQKSATVVGNLIADNNSSNSPKQAMGAFGLGVGLSGANSNLFERNLIAGNWSTGLQVTNTEDLPSVGNRLTDNVFEENGVDVADLSASRTPSSDTCISGGIVATVLPAGFAESCGTGSPGAAQASDLPAVTVPPGISFLKVPAGPRQPGMTGNLSQRPAALPRAVAMPDLALVGVPDRQLFAERVKG
ncbi:right-handed parallel beta-helix repeat-containing protein [Salinibacterium sp.]|uniref:right-handed parallel beta-helix repeat-containing protein n=1 Tax=Salinibacterium sp. TaxID=1915057 RepID=UPI00286BC4B1|nr:right-handed parallel beta-helix repeat-containing protein [Salinibacterium sp.]